MLSTQIFKYVVTMYREITGDREVHRLSNKEPSLDTLLNI